MKRILGFISGTAFTAALIITCSGGNHGQVSDAGQPQHPSDTGLTNANDPETGRRDSFFQRDFGIGEAKAQGQPAAATGWDYGYIDVHASRSNNFVGTPGVDCSSCPDSYNSTGIYNLSAFSCCANMAGSAGWELVSTTSTSSGPSGMVFKRPK